MRATQWYLLLQSNGIAVAGTLKAEAKTTSSQGTCAVLSPPSPSILHIHTSNQLSSFSEYHLHSLLAIYRCPQPLYSLDLIELYGAVKFRARNPSVRRQPQARCIAQQFERSGRPIIRQSEASLALPPLDVARVSSPSLHHLDILPPMSR